MQIVFMLDVFVGYIAIDAHKDSFLLRKNIARIDQSVKWQTLFSVARALVRI